MQYVKKGRGDHNLSSDALSTSSSNFGRFIGSIVVTRLSLVTKLVNSLWDSGCCSGLALKYWETCNIQGAKNATPF